MDRMERLDNADYVILSHEVWMFLKQKIKELKEKVNENSN